MIQIKKQKLVVICLAAAFLAPMVTSRAHGGRNAAAQDQKTAEQKVEFETASIKPASDSGDFVPGFTQNSYRANSITPQQLIRQAYDLRAFQISGVPPWAANELYDVEAKMDEATADALKAMNPIQRSRAQKQMLQSLIEDRFGLKLHHESKEESVYFLTVAKSGFKLQPSKPTPEKKQLLGADDSGVSGYATFVRPSSAGAVKYVAYAVSMTYLARMLTSDAGRPVLDKTGLNGTYDFTIEYMPDVARGIMPAADSAVPSTLDPGAGSVFTVLPQQLGLQLDAGRGQIDVMVIDHIDRPSGN